VSAVACRTGSVVASPSAVAYSIPMQIAKHVAAPKSPVKVQRGVGVSKRDMETARSLVRNYYYVKARSGHVRLAGKQGNGRALMIKKTLGKKFFRTASGRKIVTKKK